MLPTTGKGGLTALALALAILAAGCGTENAERSVVLICIEGARADLFAQARVPALDALKAGGASARELVPPFPANSSPGQASLMTGCYPDKHCVVNNRFHDRSLDKTFEGEPGEDGELLKSEPLWVAAERAGVRTAVSGWLGATAPYDGVSPAVISSLPAQAGDGERCAEACRWISSRKYRLVMVYFSSLDEAGHNHGPLSEEACAAASELDNLVSLIVEAAGSRAAVLVVSDHGMTEVKRCLHLVDFLKAVGVQARPLASGGTANLYLEPGQDAAGALASLRDREMFRLIDEAGLFEAYAREEMPGRYRNMCGDRSGDIIMVAHEGTYFREQNRRRTFLNPPKVPGMHGFDPEAEGMAGLFIAAGPGIKSGAEIKTARCVDVYPTICRLLGIDPAAGIDGEPLEAIFTRPGRV